jgi:hypothetical protein
MKLKTLTFAIALAMTSLTVMAEDKKPAKIEKAQAMCPVMKNKINKKLFVDVEGKRIYVCCPPCIKKVKKSPAKYIKILEDKGVKIEDAPKADEKKK